MLEPVACPCTIYDPRQHGTAREVTVNWTGAPGVVGALGVPARLHPRESVTVPAITLAPLSDPVKIAFEATEALAITWHQAESADAGALLRPDSRGQTVWEATFTLGSVPLSRPRQMHVRLSLQRVMLPPWFISATKVLSGVAAGGFLVSVALITAGGGSWIAPFAALLGLCAVIAYPSVLRALSRRFEVPLPTRQEAIGSIPLPPIELEPVALRSESVEHPIVASYCERLAQERAQLQILGLSLPINLDDGYVPIPLRLIRGPEAHTFASQQRYRQVDELIESDLSLRQLLGGELLTPEEAWNRHMRLTIVGEVGAGKTTILQRLSISLARGPVLWTVTVPVVIELHALARRPGIGERPVEVLRRAVVETIRGEDAAEARTAEASALVGRLIEGGELSLFFDALDEVSAPAGEEEQLVAAVVSAIAAAAEEWPHVRIVVTCRRASMDRYRRLPDSFVVAETVPFEADGIRHFVNRYFAETPQRATRLLDEVGRNPRLRAMATTPLLLALITLIFEQRGSLPQRRTEVYRRCADLLLREWDAHRQRERFPRFLVEHKEEILRSIAWELHREGVRHVEHQRLLKLLREVLPSVGLQPGMAEDVLREITTHHGLIRSYGADWYGFVHFALQEYFAAECIEHRSPLAVAIEHRHQAWWQEIIRLYAGRGDCTELVVALLQQREDLFHTNLRLAGECLAQGTAVQPELRAAVLAELYAVALAVPTPKLDIRFWQVLARAAGEAYAERLWKALSDPSLRIEVRACIARELNATGESFHQAALPRLTDEELAPEVRMALAEAICASGTREVCRPLIDIVSKPGVNEEVRAAIARESAKIGSPDLVAPFRELVLGQGTPTRLRRECAATLRTLGATGITPALLRMLGDWHIEPPIRSSLASVVGELREEQCVPDIVRTLGDARLPSAIRMSLAASLKRLRSPVLTEALLSLLGDLTSDYGVRLAVSDTLCSLATETDRIALRALYGDRRIEEPIRTRLAVALGALGETDVVPVLVRLLGDRSSRPHLRLEAARVLGSIGNGAIRDAMIGILDSRSIDLFGQELAVLVLSLRSESEAAIPLVDRLSDRRLPLTARVRMADTLATLGSSGQPDRLVSLLPDRTFAPELRGRLALAIMRLTDARNRRIFERLVELLPSTTDVPEVMTLVWHLSEQVGEPVYPTAVQTAPVAYPWLERWLHHRKDAAADVEERDQ